MSLMTDEPTRVALIGYGLGGAVFHAPLIEATSGLELAAVVTSNPERAAQAVANHSGVTVLASAEEVWRRADSFDLVVVTTPNSSHASLALAAIAERLPVVVDKPFARSVAEATSVLEAAVAAGVPLTVYQNRRWDADFLTLQRLLGEGALGTVSRFESRFERWRPVPKPGWRESGSPAEAGGLLFDLGSHLTDQALVLFGPVTRVYAEVDRRRPNIEAPDDVHLVLTHASGVHSDLWVSAVASDVGPRFRVLGDRAAYVKHGLDLQEDALRDGGRPDLDERWGIEPEASWGTLGTPGDSSPVATEPGAYQRFYAGVAAALRDGAPMPVDPRDSIEGLRIIEAAERSHLEGAVISLAHDVNPAR
jgi:scyllo-inositol 2-dehydrogenase (NADP+)